MSMSVVVDVFLIVGQVQEEIILSILLVQLRHHAGRGHHDLVVCVDEQRSMLSSV